MAKERDRTEMQPLAHPSPDPRTPEARTASTEASPPTDVDAPRSSAPHASNHQLAATEETVADGATAGEEVRAWVLEVEHTLGQVVVGMEPIIQQFLIALVARGHILLEGVPGTAKTTLAKAFAEVLGMEYQRVQFTPDLLPSDITGTFVYDPASSEFKLRQGPIFAHLLLADEVNRAPAKTQAALLEAMQENQVTIEGTTLRLPQPFFVLATQNPIEQEGVYRLPEAQLDRFLIRVRTDYPDEETELAMVRRMGGLAGAPLVSPEKLPILFSAERILDLQQRIGSIHVEESVARYVVDLARTSRIHPAIALGASPRATLFLLQAARARAMLQGRLFATHEDVQSVAEPVLGHRLILHPEAELDGVTTAQVIGRILERLPVLETGRSGR